MHLLPHIIPSLLLATIASAHFCYDCEEWENSTDFKICATADLTKLPKTDCNNFTSCAYIMAQETESLQHYTKRGCGWSRFCSKYEEEANLTIQHCTLCEPDVCVEGLMLHGGSDRYMHWATSLGVICAAVIALLIE